MLLVIGPEQQGFIKGRQMLRNVMRMEAGGKCLSETDAMAFLLLLDIIISFSISSARSHLHHPVSFGSGREVDECSHRTLSR